MKLSRDTWLGIGLLLLLVLVTVAAAIQQTNAPVIPYLSTSSAPNGTLALRLWLEKEGYRSLDSASPAFQPPEQAKLVFILEPLEDISDVQFSLIDGWVEDGGTLILAGDNFPTSTAMDHYHFAFQFLDQPVTDLSVQTPLMTSPPIAAPAPLKADLALSTGRADFITHLAAGGQPVLVSFGQGRGRVILSSAPYFFSNIGLKEDANARLALNLVALTVHRGGFWFDDWHHGARSGSIIGPGQWLRFTPGGHALLFVVGAVFLALLLQGRGFGRPVPLPHEIRRRGPLEHVTAIANLNRKAGHRSAVLGQYHHRLKRHLGRRYRLDPSLPDGEYAEMLARYNPAVDKAALLGLLNSLSQKNIGESEMVKLAAEASQWIHKE
jgi:hypothetical protein